MTEQYDGSEDAVDVDTFRRETLRKLQDMEFDIDLEKAEENPAFIRKIPRFLQSDRKAYQQAVTADTLADRYATNTASPVNGLSTYRTEHGTIHRGVATAETMDALNLPTTAEYGALVRLVNDNLPPSNHVIPSSTHAAEHVTEHNTDYIFAVLEPASDREKHGAPRLEAGDISLAEYPEGWTPGDSVYIDVDPVARNT